MAGVGRAPKDRSERVGRHVPQRGEWVTLPSENPARTRKLPPPPRGGWAARTKRAWKAWWTDPASLVWSAADVDAVEQLAYLHHDHERAAKASAPMLAEIRRRMDALGLTQKGKRDLRLRVGRDELEEKRAESTASASRYSHLRAVVNDAVEGTELRG